MKMTAYIPTYAIVVLRRTFYRHEVELDFVVTIQDIGIGQQIRSWKPLIVLKPIFFFHTHGNVNNIEEFP